VRLRLRGPRGAALPALPRQRPPLPGGGRGAGCRRGASAPLSAPAGRASRAARGRAMTQLLVSVRAPAEVAPALAGGAALIDVKEPSRGPLGKADDAVIAAVLAAVAGRCPVSAAMGEVARAPLPPTLPECDYLKWGLSGCSRRGPGRHDWRRLLAEAAVGVSARSPRTQAVTVAYADWHLAEAPPVEDVCAFAGQRPGVLLLDTFTKGPGNGA